MSDIERSIDVDVPIQVAYDQWTQFEDFPQFMNGVESIEQIDDQLTHWAVEIGGVRREFDAVITVQRPDQGVSWRSVDGPAHAGAVRFEQLTPTSTRVFLTMNYETEGFVEKVGDALGVVERQAKGDLQRFKSFIEERGAATGQWRGSISS